MIIEGGGTAHVDDTGATEQARGVLPAAAVEVAVHAAAAAQGFALGPDQTAALPAVARLVAGEPGRSAYLWGPVGRGKTWLVDAALAVAGPAPATRRTHLAALSADLHTATGRRYGTTGTSHSWDRAVADVLDRVGLLALDELHLHDSDDVWMAERLLRRLLARGGRLLATSNYPVEGLHSGHPHAAGLVALLQACADAWPLSGPVDHRTHVGAGQDHPGFASGAWVHPVTDARLVALGLARPQPADRVVLTVGGRPLPVALPGDGPLWVSFSVLCEGLTAASDLLALAQEHRTWVLAGLPTMASCSPDARHRFRAAVDVAHDRDVRLVVLARAPFDEALAGPDLPPDFARTVSRLSLLSR